MTVASRRSNNLPATVVGWLERAKRIEQITLAARVSSVIALYLTLGGDQALTAVWLRSLWTLLPPLAFLLAFHIEQTPPTPRFPLGFYRAGSIAFLATSLALFTMGLYLVATAGKGLFEADKPALVSLAQSASIIAWPGWPMIAALVYTGAIPFFLGGPRKRHARVLNDKGLHADAATGHANVLAAGAAIAGIIGVELGYWWADYLAVLVIGLDIVRIGLRHVYTATRDLMDELPRRPGSHAIDPLKPGLEKRLLRQDWIVQAEVLLRQHGRMLVGVARIEVAEHDDLVARCRRTRDTLQALDWRLFDFYIIPTPCSPIDTEHRPDPLEPAT